MELGGINYYFYIKLNLYQGVTPEHKFKNYLI